ILDVVSCVRGYVVRLVCRCCAADVQSTMRCGTCRALHPTSELRAAILSPSVFVGYSLIIFLFFLLSNWCTTRRFPPPWSVEEQQACDADHRNYCCQGVHNTGGRFLSIRRESCRRSPRTTGPISSTPDTL